ncbi:MAG: low molecular weight phosphotyrosine protein phosphatase, partial [Rhodospirillaceae bacterium]|nr:low molecular weight phosphotyrosine protein phosphatase [Rhodospirillaceae bacterium]
MVSVLFVCLGNICRSPTAEGVFRAMVDQAGLSEHITIDSAGTAAYHVGEAPDRRATLEAKN